MKLSELISKLEELKREHGDLDVKVQTLSHLWKPEPELRPIGKTPPSFVLLNP